MLKKLQYISVALLALFILNYYGVFNPVLDRQEQLSSAGIVDTGRDDLKIEAFRVYNESDYLGIGWGETNLDKALRAVEQSHHIGVHNYYYNLLAEVGIPGTLLFVVLMLLILLNINYKHTLSFYAILLSLLTFSTEPIFTQGEFIFPAFFLFMCTLNKEQNENTLHMLS